MLHSHGLQSGYPKCPIEQAKQSGSWNSLRHSQRPVSSWQLPVEKDSSQLHAAMDKGITNWLKVKRNYTNNKWRWVAYLYTRPFHSNAFHMVDRISVGTYYSWCLRYCVGNFCIRHRRHIGHECPTINLDGRSLRHMHRSSSDRDNYMLCHKWEIYFKLLWYGAIPSFSLCKTKQGKSYVHIGMDVLWYSVAIFSAHTRVRIHCNECWSCGDDINTPKLALFWSDLDHMCPHDRYTDNGHQSKYLWSNRNTTKTKAETKTKATTIWINLHWTKRRVDKTNRRVVEKHLHVVLQLDLAVPPTSNDRGDFSYDKNGSEHW